MPRSPPSIYGGMPKLGSAALAAASWQCQRCSHMNSAEKARGTAFCAGGGGTGLLQVLPALRLPRRRQDTDDHGYSSRQRNNVTTVDVPTQEICNDPITRHPNAIILMAPRPCDDRALLSVGSHHFADKNDAPNGASLCKGDRSTKREEKRKSPSRDLGGMVLHPLPMQLPPTIRPMRSITPPPPSQFRSLPQEGIAGEESGPLMMCHGVSVGNLGANLTAAAAMYEHTTRFLRDFESDPDFRIKRFAASVLAKSAGWDNAARKANAFNASKTALVGNNSLGENPFSRNTKF
jgi:hypothetical protein